MSVITGLAPSFGHPQNGMTLPDMEAAGRVATQLAEVIIFRSTGPWAKRWLARGYPSKNFHVKGKSSDWGPHAGLVPYDGIYSKVGYSAAKAIKGTQANDAGLASGFAGRGPLKLSHSLLNDQMTKGEGKPPKIPATLAMSIAGTDDLFLTAQRSGDGATVLFRAVRNGVDFDIMVYPPPIGYKNPFVALGRDPTGAQAVPLLVMTSSESGANNLPMTGDYDLMAVCPTWGQYGGVALTDISKAGIALNNGVVNAGMTFAAGVGMDNVMDARLHTAGTREWHDFGQRKKQYQTAMRAGHAMSPDSIRLITQADKWEEHGDMGNLTPRILRCINALNAAMGATGDKSAMRRVHHNAESHRNAQFGALTALDMVTKKDGEDYADGFPLTVFQPVALASSRAPAANYGEVCTLETLLAFQQYTVALKESGYYVPKSMLWKI